MSFFSKLFGFKNENTNHQNQSKHKQIEPKIGQPFFTNAPSHWGVITDDFLESSREFGQNFDENIVTVTNVILQKRMFMTNSLILLGKINSNLSEKYKIKIIPGFLDGLFDSKEKYATSCCIEKLFDNGVILTNGIVIDNFEKYAVFLFTKPVSILYINELKEKFIKYRFKDLIYYCIINPETVNTQDFIELPYIGLQKESFRLKEEQSRENRKYNDYGLWWTDNSNVIFSDSTAYEILSNYYEKCNDVYTYVLGKLGYALGRNENDTRVKIPEYDEIVIEGPEGVEIILTISEKTGINFHFPINPIFENYRDDFFKNFLEFSIDIKNQVVLNNFDRDLDIIRPEWIEKTQGVKNIESISLIISDKMLKYLN